MLTLLLAQLPRTAMLFAFCLAVSIGVHADTPPADPEPAPADPAPASPRTAPPVQLVGPRQEFERIALRGEYFNYYTGGLEEDITLKRIITLSKQLSPAPAIPEEARRHFVSGNVLAKTGNSVREQFLAIQEFNEALRLAPWWPDAYYNRAVAEGLVGLFVEARTSLKYYLLSNPPDAQQARDRIYALDAREKLAKGRAKQLMVSLNNRVYALESDFIGGRILKVLQATSDGYATGDLLYGVFTRASAAEAWKRFYGGWRFCTYSQFSGCALGIGPLEQERQFVGREQGLSGFYYLIVISADSNKIEVTTVSPWLDSYFEARKPKPNHPAWLQKNWNDQSAEDYNQLGKTETYTFDHVEKK